MTGSNPSNNQSNNQPHVLNMTISDLYHKNFPSDKASYKYRIPFIGLVLSILSLHYSTYYYYLWFSTHYLLIWAYILIALGVHYEYSWGISIGDFKHYTPLIIFKIIEICVSFSMIIYATVKMEHDDFIVGTCMTGIVFTILNIGYTIYVAYRSSNNIRHLLVTNVPAEENRFSTDTLRT